MLAMKISAGISLFYLLAAIIPAALWWLGDGIVTWTSNRYVIMTNLAQLFGVVGLGIFAGNLILSGRYIAIDKLFGGLDKAYRVHRQSGKQVFWLLTTHLLLIFAQGWDGSAQRVWSFIIDFSVSSVNYGKAAYLLMIVVVGITLYLRKRIEYEWLKNIHRLLGAALLLGGLHAFFIPSTIAFNWPLRIYMLSLVALALGSFVWRTLGAQWLVPKWKFAVERVQEVGGRVTELVLRPVSSVVLQGTPGQFVFVSTPRSLLTPEDHPFTVADWMPDGHVRIAAKQSGDWTNKLPQIRVGTVVQLQGPFGGFVLPQKLTSDQIWIAGGIGITPFLSMIRGLTAEQLNGHRVELIYACTDAGELVFGDELTTRAGELAGFRWQPWLSRSQGRLNVAAVSKLLALEDREVYICGPAPMIRQLRDGLVRAGVDPGKIHFELFELL